MLVLFFSNLDAHHQLIISNDDSEKIKMGTQLIIIVGMYLVEQGGK